MNSFSEIIFLPGGLDQFNHLKTKTDFSGKNILIIGANSENIAAKFLESGCESLNVIIDDHNSLLNSRLILKVFPSVRTKMMDYTNTDFTNEQFDLIYAQASVSTFERNKIIREINRILKPEGIFSVGEITSLKDPLPKFIIDIWDTGNISPLSHQKTSEYYRDKNFILIDEIDLSGTLTEFYTTGRNLLNNEKNILTPAEKSSFKKLLNRISHESNAYLKLGGKNYMGFKSLILRKKL